MACIIDTSVLVELERQGLTWRGFVEGDLSGEPVAIAAITASELLTGILRAEPGARRFSRERYVEDLLENISVFAFDLDAARVHANLWLLLSNAGQRIGPNDLQIGATAVATGYDVLTLNVREFQRIPDLGVRQPSL